MLFVVVAWYGIDSLIQCFYLPCHLFIPCSWIFLAYMLTAVSLVHFIVYFCLTSFTLWHTPSLALLYQTYSANVPLMMILSNFLCSVCRREGHLNTLSQCWQTWSKGKIMVIPFKPYLKSQSVRVYVKYCIEDMCTCLIHGYYMHVYSSNVIHCIIYSHTVFNLYGLALWAQSCIKYSTRTHDITIYTSNKTFQWSEQLCRNGNGLKRTGTRWLFQSTKHTSHITSQHKSSNDQ